MPEIRVFIAGLGHVGRAVLALLEEPSSLQVLESGLADSSDAVCFTKALSPSGTIRALSPSGTIRALFPASALSPARLWTVAVAEAKKAGLRLENLDLEAIFGPGQAVFHRSVEEAIAVARPDMLVELSSSDTTTGGAAAGHAKAALAIGADVVFASKGALAADWDEIMGAVLNGTSVYVLSLMETGLDLNGAVKAAQEAGMAEADPSADLDGLDASAKLCILARSVMGCALTVPDP